MFLPMLPKVSSVAYNYRSLSGVKTSGFDKPDPFNIFAATVVTVPVKGFTEKENNQLFNNVVTDIEKLFDTMFGKGKHRIVAVCGFNSNGVHHFYVGVPLITSENADTRYVVNTIGRTFDRHTMVATCTGKIMRTVNGSEACNQSIETLKLAQWSQLPYDNIVH